MTYSVITDVTTDAVYTTALHDEIRNNFLEISDPDPSGSGTEHRTQAGKVIHHSTITLGDVGTAGEGQKLVSEDAAGEPFLSAKDNDGVTIAGLIMNQSRITMNAAQTFDPINVQYSGAAFLFGVDEQGGIHSDARSGLANDLLLLEREGNARMSIAGDGTVDITPAVSAGAALNINAPTAYTGNLLDLSLNSVKKLVVSDTGRIDHTPTIYSSAAFNITADSGDGKIARLQNLTATVMDISKNGEVRIIPFGTGRVGLHIEPPGGSSVNSVEVKDGSGGNVQFAVDENGGVAAGEIADARSFIRWHRLFDANVAATGTTFIDVDIPHAKILGLTVSVQDAVTPTQYFAGTHSNVDASWSEGTTASDSNVFISYTNAGNNITKLEVIVWYKA